MVERRANLNAWREFNEPSKKGAKPREGGESKGGEGKRRKEDVSTAAKCIKERPSKVPGEGSKTRGVY